MSNIVYKQGNTSSDKLPINIIKMVLEYIPPPKYEFVILVLGEDQLIVKLRLGIQQYQIRFVLQQHGATFKKQHQMQIIECLKFNYEKQNNISETIQNLQICLYFLCLIQRHVHCEIPTQDYYEIRIDDKSRIAFGKNEISMYI